MSQATQELDERDTAILAERTAKLNEVPGARVGDFVIFADEIQRRISHIWRNERDVVLSVQTSDGGSFYLGEGYVSLSGGLYPGVKEETLTQTDEQRDGSIWFFHHDRWCAGNGVHATMTFRVFRCSEPAPR